MIQKPFFSLLLCVHVHCVLSTPEPNYPQAPYLAELHDVLFARNQNAINHQLRGGLAWPAYEKTIWDNGYRDANERKYNALAIIDSPTATQAAKNDAWHTVRIQQACINLNDEFLHNRAEIVQMLMDQDHQRQIDQQHYDAATTIQKFVRMHWAHKQYTQLKKEKRKRDKKLRIELDRQEKIARIAQEQQAAQEQAVQHAAQERERQRALRHLLCTAAATKYTNQCIDQALAKVASQISAQQLNKQSSNVPTSPSKNAAKNAKKRAAKKLAQQKSELDEDTINWQRISQEKHPLDEYVQAHQIFTTWQTARDKKIKDLTNFYGNEYARIFKGEQHNPQHMQDYLNKKCEEKYFNTYIHEQRAKIALSAYEDLLQIFWDVSPSEFTSLANEVKSGLEESNANLQEFKQNLAWHLHMNEDQHNRINNYLKWSKIKQNKIYQELEEAIARKDPRYSPDELRSQLADKYQRIKSLDAFAGLHINNYCLDTSAFQDPQQVHEAMNKGNIPTKELRAAEKRIRTILETENESTAHLSIAPILDRLLTIAQVTSSQSSNERIIHPSVMRCNELHNQYRLKNNLESFATPQTTQTLHRCLFDLFTQLNKWQEHPYTAEQIADEAKISMVFCKPYILTRKNTTSPSL